MPLKSFDELLHDAEIAHGHLCAGQILGVRMAMLGLELLGLDDPYGSLITDIAREDFEKLGYALDDKVTVQINKKPVTLPYVKTFMNVPVGDSLLYIDSRNRVAIAINQGSYSKKFGVEPPATVHIPKKNATVPKLAKSGKRAVRP